MHVCHNYKTRYTRRRNQVHHDCSSLDSAMCLTVTLHDFTPISRLPLLHFIPLFKDIKFEKGVTNQAVAIFKEAKAETATQSIIV